MKKENQLIVISNRYEIKPLLSKDNISTVIELQNAVADYLKFEETLKMINRRLFLSAGKVEKLTPTIDAYLLNQDEETKSRIRRLFSVGYELRDLFSGYKLYVKKDNYKEKIEKSFYSFILTLSHGMDLVEDGNYYVKVNGAITPKYQKAPVRLVEMKRGYTIFFPFKSPPRGEELDHILMDNIMNVLGELEEEKYIPSLRNLKASPFVQVLRDLGDDFTLKNIYDWAAIGKAYTTDNEQIRKIDSKARGSFTGDEIRKLEELMRKLHNSKLKDSEEVWTLGRFRKMISEDFPIKPENRNNLSRKEFYILQKLFKETDDEYVSI